MLKRPAIIFGWLLLAAVFVLGLEQLFELRFDRGDIYPPYSSLRADPLGASVLYESLEHVDGVSAARYFEPVLQEEQGGGRALFVLGLSPYDLSFMSRSEFETLQQFIRSGGRVVISYLPQPKQTWSARREEAQLADERRRTEDKIKKRQSAKSKKADEPKPSRRRLAKQQKADEEQDDLRKELKVADLHEEWSFRPAFRSSITNEPTATKRRPFEKKPSEEITEPTEVDVTIDPVVASCALTNTALPPRLAVHTALYFSGLSNLWTTVYADGKFPVVVERQFGKGAVVLVADSYPFSNEAMLKDRAPTLLAWMLGGGRAAIFDEAHLGVVTNPGVATLMRKYRLHGLIFSLLVVALLFIWKNSVSLVPPHADAEAFAGPVVLGKDSTAGFVNLLRRGIPQAEILTACHAEWKKSGARRARMTAAQAREVEQLVAQEQALAPRARKPVQTYRAISEILKRKNP